MTFKRRSPVFLATAVMVLAVAIPVFAAEDIPQLRLQNVPDDGIVMLETQEMAEQDASMTPVSDMRDGGEMLETPAVMEQDMTRWEDLQGGNLKENNVEPEPAEAALDLSSAKKKASEPSSQPELIPAVDAPPVLFEQAPAEETTAEPKTDRHEHKVSVVTYAPLQAVAVFPVVKHHYERAFGDLPVLFSREFAMKMEEKVPTTRVFHPVYTVEEIRALGLGHIYDQVMDYYRKAGRPEPAALDYLMERLNVTGQQQVARVIFVEADLDMNHTAQNTGVLEKVKGFMTDGLPKQGKYFVRSRVQVFNAQEPGYPMMWAYNASEMVPDSAFYNMTPSVFSDSDSQMNLARASREISGKMLWAMPQEVYMERRVETGVKGELVSDKSGFSLPETLDTLKRGITQEDRNILRRILSRDEE